MLYEIEEEYYTRFLVSALRSRFYKTKTLDYCRPRLVLMRQGPLSHEEEALRYSVIMELYERTTYRWEECVDIVDDVIYRRE